MQKESVEIFREVEKKTGNQILVGGGLLYMKTIGHPDIKEFLKYGELLSADQINQRWPALRIPSYIEGVYAQEAGITNVKHALDGFRNESSKLGADLRYGQNVVNIDHANSTVTLENGDIYKAKNIVVTCGSTTDQFYQRPNQFKAKK